MYFFRSGIGYLCDGYFSEFAKCKDFTTEPLRKKFVIPSWAKNFDAFSDNGEKKFSSLYPQKRCFQIIKPPSSRSPSVAAAGPSGSRKRNTKTEGKTTMLHVQCDRGSSIVICSKWE